jgi:hypothetical protein
MAAPTSQRRTHLRCALALTPKALDLLADTVWVPVVRLPWFNDKPADLNDVEQVTV